MGTKKTKKTFHISANFEHTVDFTVNAYSEKEAMKLVEKHQFDGMNPDVKYEDGDFGGLLGIMGCE